MRTNCVLRQTCSLPVALPQLRVVVHFHVADIELKASRRWFIRWPGYFRTRDDPIEKRKHRYFRRGEFARSRQRPRTGAWSILENRVSSMPIRLNRLYVTLARAYVRYMYPFTCHSLSVIVLRDHIYVLAFAAMGHTNVRWPLMFLRHCTKLYTPATPLRTRWRSENCRLPLLSIKKMDKRERILRN